MIFTSIPGPPSNGAGPPTPADGTALTSTLRVPVKPARLKRELTFEPHQRPEPTTPEKGGADPLTRVVRHALLSRRAAATAPCAPDCTGAAGGSGLRNR